MHCAHFSANRCRSCAWLDTPYPEQLAAKQHHIAALLQPFAVQTYLPPILSPETAFRNKAKMVALGAAHAPILGIVSPTGEAVSLVYCPLYPESMQTLLKYLERWIQIAGIPPYRIDKAKGELKYLLLTQAHSTGEFLLRLVLRSEEALPRIQTNLPKLLQDFPKLRVVSVNIQPIHMAVLEGEQEIFLTEETVLPEQLNDVPLYIRPKSFFQTNPTLASRLYQTAREWTQTLNPSHIWDLFCGVGGFGLHCASTDTHLTGIEIEPEAIACAKRSAQELGLKNISFQALDSEQFANHDADKPDLIIVNPPRRGIGATLAQRLNRFAPNAILYSSCNATTLAKDVTHLTDYEIEKVQLFDMFPHTAHYEVLVLLTRKHS